MMWHVRFESRLPGSRHLDDLEFHLAVCCSFSIVSNTSTAFLIQGSFYHFNLFRAWPAIVVNLILKNSPLLPIPFQLLKFLKESPRWWSLLSGCHWLDPPSLNHSPGKNNLQKWLEMKFFPFVCLIVAFNSEKTYCVLMPAPCKIRE